MAEKLSITIFLEGAAEIERQLEGIGEAGTKAFGEIGKAAENVGGFDKLDPKDVQAKLQKFGVTGKAAIDKITAAVAQAGRLERIVGGVRQVEAGFASIGVAASAMSQRVSTAFTAIATAAAGTGGAIGRVGRALGILGSGALIGSVGAAAVAMEKTADSARVLEGNLQALFRNAAAGTQFFNQIQNAARTAGSSLEATAQTMVGIVKTLQKELQAKGFRFAPGEGLKQATDDAAAVFDTLQKGIKLTGTRADEATKAIKDLFTEISKNQAARGDTFTEIGQKAKRMADVLRELGARFPQLANELVKFLGVPGQSMEQLADQVENGLKRIDIPKFIDALKRADPEIQKLFANFDATIAQRMDTIGGAWDRLLNSFAASPSGAAIKAALDDIAKGLDEIAAKKPPTTWTGEFLLEVMKTIETTKREFDGLVSVINQILQNVGKGLPNKIVLPFEADPEPPWVEAYLGFIEKIKIAFRAMTKPDEAEGPPQQPAWVEAYLGWIAKVKAAFLDMFTKRPEVGGSLGGGAVPLFGSATPELEAVGAARIEDRRGQGLDTTAINAALTELATAAQGATQSLQGLQGLDFSSIATAADFLNTAISSVADGMQSLDFSGMATALASATAAAQELGTGLQSLGLSEVAAAMQQVVSAANSAAEALSNIQAQSSDGFARGGLLGGRGTGTSDSNLAWVSRGEHIMPARAVRQPGVLTFLEALRRSGGSLQDVLDDMGRFALGGLVPRSIPAFASGGLVASAGAGRQPVNLTIHNGASKDTFRMWADAEVAEKVVRYAVSRQVASAGRKSGAFG